MVNRDHYFVQKILPSRFAAWIQINLTIVQLCMLGHQTIATTYIPKKPSYDPKKCPKQQMYIFVAKKATVKDSIIIGCNHVDISLTGHLVKIIHFM